MLTLLSSPARMDRALINKIHIDTEYIHSIAFHKEHHGKSHNGEKKRCLCPCTCCVLVRPYRAVPSRLVVMHSVRQVRWKLEGQREEDRNEAVNRLSSNMRNYLDILGLVWFVIGHMWLLSNKK